MERSRYSPVVADEQGQIAVQLAADHPGLTDPEYRSRRNQLAQMAADWQPGEAVPTPSYTSTEDEVWATVSSALEGLHERRAARCFLEGKGALKLPTDRVPQLTEVTARLEPLVGFRYLPVAGLAPLRHFYASFADGTFWSTQYLRHPSLPLYTPEPDIIHEVIGHANQLASPAIAEIYRAFGRAVERTRSEQALRMLSRIFWFSMEFGVIVEGGELRALGAGILSSVGETESFDQVDIRPANLAEMANASYDITHYQPVLYSFASMGGLEDTLGELLVGFDDDTAGRLAEAGAAAEPEQARSPAPA
ncbi:MAG: phenylalanine 4-monooxygenase [Acidimicrobiales bacterium]